MKKLIAYDLGTGGIKASLFSETGHSLANVFYHYDTLFPKEHFVEQSPMDWWNSVCTATKDLLKKSHSYPSEIACVALSGHSLTAVPIAADGSLLQEQVPIWSDMRAVSQAKRLFQQLDYNSWYAATGNGDPAECYTVAKLMWMKEQQPQIYERIKKIIGSKDFINYKLTGILCTDPSYASGFGVFDLLKWDYEPAFMKAAGLDTGIFPEIHASDEIIGFVTKEAAAECGLSEGTPVACGAVDNTCMALGATGFQEGVAYTSLGSSSWIAVTSQKPVIDPLTRPFVFAHAVRGYYTSAVSIFSAGNSFRWIRDHLCRDFPRENDTYDEMNRMSASVPAGSNGVLFNPSLSGGSAQEPSPLLCGSFMGLTLRNTREDLVRASMEGIAFSLNSALDILKNHVEIQNEMLICGGGSKSAVWRQIFADIYRMNIRKTNIDQDAAALGAAALAANACGLWNGYDNIQTIHITEDICAPVPANSDFYERIKPIYKEWTQSLAKLGEEMADVQEHHPCPSL